jgi:hypothetical protein
LDWVNARLKQLNFSDKSNASAIEGSPRQRTISLCFLTPTSLKSEEQVVRQPEFHHLFKRVRDRLNALSTFYGSGPIAADFHCLGEHSEQVKTIKANFEWRERSRRSSKTHQRHELSGFVGDCTYEGDLHEFLPWLVAGELIHVGRHTAWGGGRYRIQ